MAADSGKVDPRLDNPLPDFASSIWIIFNSLGRPPSMGGLSRISQQEIAAYQSNYGIRLMDFELEMIQMLDSIALEIFNKEKPQ